MSHHSAYCLNGNAHRQSDMCSEIMPRLVEGKAETVLLAELPGKFYQIGSAIKIENLTVLPLVPVFLHYSHWDVKQAYRRATARLLPVYMYPPRTVRSLGYVILSQLFKICVCQPCEAIENYQCNQ